VTTFDTEVVASANCRLPRAVGLSRTCRANVARTFRGTEAEAIDAERNTVQYLMQVSDGLR